MVYALLFFLFFAWCLWPFAVRFVMQKAFVLQFITFERSFSERIFSERRFPNDSFRTLSSGAHDPEVLWSKMMIWGHQRS